MARSARGILVQWYDRHPYPLGLVRPKVGASVLATVVSIAVVATLIVGRPIPDKDRSSSLPKEAGPVAILFGNEPGNYSIRYPAGWLVSRAGSITHVKSPDKRAVASFGVDDASGDVLNSFFRLQDMLLHRYSSVSFERPRTASWSAGTTIVASGRLVNSGGTRLHFLAASVEGTVHNYVVVAFEEVGGAGPRKALRRIVTSFEESSPT
jgi:hypothetical protein